MTMIREFCGGQIIKKNVRKHYRCKGQLYTIENVEAEVCRECGEHYFHAKTLDAIDRLLEGKHNVKANLQVEVVSF
jgi:YgiT-type zinc finger domain-containing protein